MTITFDEIHLFKSMKQHNRTQTESLYRSEVEMTKTSSLFVLFVDVIFVSLPNVVFTLCGLSVVARGVKQLFSRLVLVFGAADIACVLRVRGAEMEIRKEW